MQPFDRELLELLGSLIHIKEALRGIDEQGDLLPNPLETDVVAFVIDFDTAIAAHSTDKGSPMDRVQPPIGINHTRERG